MAHQENQGLPGSGAFFWRFCARFGAAEDAVQLIHGPALEFVPDMGIGIGREVVTGMPEELLNNLHFFRPTPRAGWHMYAARRGAEGSGVWPFQAVLCIFRYRFRGWIGVSTRDGNARRSER